MQELDVREIEQHVIDQICKQYLTDFEEDFVYLSLKGRRTKELSLLLDTPPCEIVRRRKVISRKVRAVYTYHFKLDPIEFLRFAVNILPEDRFGCLVCHVLELNPLKEIARKFKIQPSTAQRWLQFSKKDLEDNMVDNPRIKEFMGCFDDIPYLNIQEIKLSREEARKKYKIQIGSKLLSEWAKR